MADSRYESITMQELDPSPVDESPVDIEKGEYFPRRNKPTPAPSSRTSSLGLSGHSAIWWLTRVQRYSSYTFTAFLAAHITNTSIIPLLTHSLPAADTYLLLTRPYYQSPLMEPALIAIPLALHITSGLALRLYRRRQAVTWYGAESRDERKTIAWPKLSGISALGYALVPLALGHSFVTRIIPLWVEGGSSGVGLQYVAHGFGKFPAAFTIWHAALVAIGSWHFSWGWAKWMGWTPDGTGIDVADRELRRKRRFYGVNAISAVLSLVWMTGSLGVVGRAGKMNGWIGRAYDELYKRVPILGRWA